MFINTAIVARSRPQAKENLLMSKEELILHVFIQEVSWSLGYDCPCNVVVFWMAQFYFTINIVSLLGILLLYNGITSVVLYHDVYTIKRNFFYCIYSRDLDSLQFKYFLGWLIHIIRCFSKGGRVVSRWFC